VYIEGASGSSVGVGGLTDIETIQLRAETEEVQFVSLSSH
jgi:hypothetical protein